MRLNIFQSAIVCFVAILFFTQLRASEPMHTNIAEHMQKPSLKQSRTPEEYLKETEHTERIIIIGGGRVNSFQYPPNAFLANKKYEKEQADQPNIDITNPNSIPQELSHKFDVVIWENVDSPLFFKKETFESIKSFLKKGGIFIANNPLFFQDREIFFKNNCNRKSFCNELKEFHAHLWDFPTSISPQNVWYENPPYTGDNDPHLIQDAFTYLLKPWIESQGFAQVILDPSSKYWYSTPSHNGYIVAHY